MAKWQTEIYQGELGQTVKAEYRNLIAIGKSEPDAEHIIVEHCLTKLVSCSEDEGHMWIALALRQWEYGRLSCAVKEKALYWASQTLPGISMDTLGMLKSTIESPMNRKKCVPLPSWVKKCPWPVGSLLAYRIISNQQENVRNSPYWGKYVLLRVIKIVRQPVTWLAPETGCSESMLVGLYNWCGEGIPNPSIADSLEFTPIAITGSSLSSTALGRISPDVIKTLGDKNLNHLINSVTNHRVETCCCLDWTCTKGINRNDVFTYLDCNPDFQYNIPDFFKTEITDYSFSHSVPFDVTLYNRLVQLDCTEYM